MDIGPFVPPSPSACLISSTVIRNVTEDELPFTHTVMQWGQFLDHDLDLGPCQSWRRSVKAVDKQISVSPFLFLIVIQPLVLVH